MSRHHGSGFRRGEARTSRARSSRAAAAVALALAILTPIAARAMTEGERAVAVAPKSDMQIGVTASAGFASGSNATYTLSVIDNGPQSAPGPITVTDTLPAGLTYASATAPAGWSCAAAGQVVTCTMPGAFAKGVTNTITIVAAITSAVATSVTNIVTVTDGANDDTDLTNNRATVTSAVTVRRVATTPDGATVTSLPSNGTNYTQTFVLTNQGNVSDSYALVAGVAPAGIVTIVSVNGTAGSSSTSAAVAAGGTANVVVVYSVATGAATGATAALTLTATSTVTATSANVGDLTVTVARAGITMSKLLYRDDRTTLVTGPAAVLTNEFVQYKVTVTSTGGVPASAVSVADVIPAQVTYDAATGDVAGWTFVKPAGTLTASLTGTLAAGTSRFFWIRVRVN
jgi:uncharacterized repeat protein (TIGR01451 family)